MANPIPGSPVSTPYGKRGRHWSCDKNSAGLGIHTGIDIAAPVGTKIYAPIAGQIRHRHYGSAFGNHQFAISPDDGQPFGKGEVFFAHCSARLKDGTRVKIGDYIGKVGAEGNVTGPHLHMEYMPRTKGVWRCGIHANPKPVLEYGAAPPKPKWPAVTKNIYTDKLGFGEPTNGDKSSDTVKELQSRLNEISLPGGRELPVTGKYGEMTDAEVRKWQEHAVEDKPDPARKSFLGPKQVAKMFPSNIYTIHDKGLPAVADEQMQPTPDTRPDFEPKDGTTLGKWLAEQGFKVNDKNVSIGRASTWLEPRFIMWHHTGGNPDSTAAAEAKWIRTGNEDAPLAQIMVDQEGVVWLCSYERKGQKDPGRASHAGTGQGFGVPDDKMNEVSVGIEFHAPGDKPISAYPKMYSVGVNLTAALCYRYGLTAESVIGHKEWSDRGKIDPKDDMDVVRAAVADVLDTPVTPPTPPDPPPTKPEFVTRDEYEQDMDRIKDAFGAAGDPE